MYCDTDTLEKIMHQKYISTIISFQYKPWFLRTKNYRIKDFRKEFDLNIL